MNSKERVLGAIQRTEVDKIPCDFRAEKPTLTRLFKYLGHSDYDKMLEDFRVDIRYLNCIAPKERNKNGYMENYWGERYVYRKTKWGSYRDDMPGALADARILADFEAFNWPHIGMMDYSTVRPLSQKYNDYGIMYGFGDIFTRPSNVRGFENFLIDLYENPEFVHYMIKKYTDFYIEDYTKAYRESEGRIDIFLIMGDLASQRSPLIAPEMFDVFVGPELKRLAERIHDLGAALMFHSCGDAYVFMDRLIDCGVDIIDPIQRTSIKMEPENLAAEFGSRVCFHGGIDVQTTLPHGTPEEVREEVKRYIKAFRVPGKGYICCSAHYMQHDIPPENIVAMYDAIANST